ncbi:HAD-IC family P-type ATPase [Patescibacteria group bacterium]|nr:HAD-IC family P-type ATPase [Patescibacteria group bacterium]
MTKEVAWHSLSWREVVEKLKSDYKDGLDEKEVKERREKFGRNLLPKEKSLSKLEIFLEQFKSPLIYILVIAGIVVLFFKEFTDAIVIFGAVILNTVVGYFQENKASQALRKLKKIVKIKAQVIREGNIKIIDSGELVPGDIFILSPGDKVPADGRIIESYNLKTNEMALTGEWLPAEKKSDVLPGKTPLADRDNMVYMGTVTEDGKAKVVVTSTGLETEIGEVAQMVKEAKEEKTPLQKKLARFAKIVGGVIVAICIVIFIEGVITGNTLLEMFEVAVAVAVAAIPEGLPVAMTVILALGMQRILKKRGLVRKLASAETLGSTSIIATDKTATLTEGKMKVTEILTETKAGRRLALKIATLCNEAFIENPEEPMEKWVIRGRPTDKALLLAGVQAGINKKELERKMLKTAELPFSTINKYLARAFALSKKEDILYISGAPEKILEISKYLRKGNREIPLTPEIEDKIKAELEELTGEGLRVVAVGYKKIKSLKSFFDNLVFVGLIALKDPVRKEVKKAIKICRQAGMKPIIATGDHKLTAKAVAQELGFKVKEENIMEGRELDKLSDKEFEKRVKDIQIYARVEPKHKMRIIQAWQEKGEVIAMTGDGINDAPALKKADIGVALGSGTEVAKEVSDLVLLTDNFNIIVAAVEEGRAIIDNVRKVITYLLSDSFTETILIGVGLFFGYLPITAVQILWVNLIEDGLPDIALAFEPKEKDLMKQKPQGHDMPLLNREMKVLIFIIGIITDLFLLGLFFWLLKYSNYEIPHIRTVIFGGLAIDSLFYVFSCKSLRRNVWHINPFSNKFLVFAWVFGALTLIGAIYLSPLQTLLKTVPLNLFDWGLLLTLGLINLILIEATKHYFIVRHQTDI